MMNHLYVSNHLVIAFESPCKTFTSLLKHVDRHGKIDFPFRVGWAFPRGEDEFNLEVGMENAENNMTLQYFKLDSMYREAGKWEITIVNRSVSIIISTDQEGRFVEWWGMSMSHRKSIMADRDIEAFYEDIFGPKILAESLQKV